ncbi:HDOD domain-containing protein [Massilia sp. TS11]|uniref:HDOD domain-containing protein n=1 Tax=Massilia sp. TS11 TaxID=2908003 RepID=UPI001ED9EE50|nr:HDOD domain-containing protein [Massilia sp. TS11]MCG2586668.1 HDOD domain-containing protein [Massilia sp. TS11]
MNRIDAFKHIAHQAARGELHFPTHVQATLKLREALADPGCHVDEAARLVQAEPLLAARTVAIANSAAYSRGGPDVTHVKAAVSRLGFSTLNALVAATIVRQLEGEITHPLVRQHAEQLWQHSAHVAALAAIIARRVSKVDANTALFAGIVHEVGGFYLLSKAEAMPEILDGDPEDWTTHGEMTIGRAVLNELNVPGPVMQAINALWVGMRALPPETLGDTLMLANDLAPVHSPLHHRPGATTLQEATTIDFAVGDGTLAQILAESQDEVAALAAALLI